VPDHARRPRRRGGAPRKPVPRARPALRARLNSPGDTAFYGCYSVLLGLLAAALVPGCVLPFLRGLDVELGGAALSMMTFLAITALALYRMVFRYVEVGADGVVVRDRLLARFIRYSDVARVKMLGVEEMKMGLHVALELRDGKEVSFRVDTLAPEERARLLARLSEEQDAYALAAREEEALAALERKGRSVADWQAAAARLLGPKGDYRSACVAAEDVARTLENPSAERDRRLGAAMALAGSGDAEAPVRIRVAAQASADPRLRIALESIASGEIDAQAVEEALAEAGREEGQAAAETAPRR
jgi:hypothetical protein